MAKTLNELEMFVESKSKDFYQYLVGLIPLELVNTISIISKKTDVYIFSGIIRNFFLNIRDIRDIDLVLEKKIDIHEYFVHSQIKENSFGGYKILYDTLPIDIWFAKDSWAYKVQNVFDFDLGKYLFKTAYFNFSAILYSINESKFYYSKHFLRFLQNKEMDIVFPINKNYDLCILNTIYYSEKYNLKVSKNLATEIFSYYYNSIHDFDKVQLIHFGKIKYDLLSIENFIKKIAPLN